MKISYRINGGMSVEKDNISIELSKDKKLDIYDFLKQYDIKLNDVQGNTKVTLDEALEKVKNYQDPSEFIKLLKLVIEQDDAKRQKLVRENTKLKRIIRELEEEQDETIENINNENVKIIKETISNDNIDINKLSFVIDEIDKSHFTLTNSDDEVKNVLAEYLANLVGSFPKTNVEVVTDLKNKYLHTFRIYR